MRLQVEGLAPEKQMIVTTIYVLIIVLRVDGVMCKTLVTKVYLGYLEKKSL